MTLAVDRRQEMTDQLSWCPTVDGLPLVECFGGEPSTETWLATLWGIHSGQSSPLPVDGSWHWGWNALRRRGDRADHQEARSWATSGSRS
jgi:hypothetical protein